MLSSSFHHNLAPAGLHVASDALIGREAGTGIQPVSRDQCVGLLVHAGDRGSHVGVHPNASLPGLQHSGFQIVQAGPGTDAQNRQIACLPAAVGEADGYAALPFLQPGDAAAEGQPHASSFQPALDLFRDCMERFLPEQMGLL